MESKTFHAVEGADIRTHNVGKPQAIPYYCLILLLEPVQTFSRSSSGEAEQARRTEPQLRLFTGLDGTRFCWSLHTVEARKLEYGHSPERSRTRKSHPTSIFQLFRVYCSNTVAWCLEVPGVEFLLRTRLVTLLSIGELM